VIRQLLQGAWNIGHRRRYDRLEERVRRIERWLEVHGPLVDPKAVFYKDQHWEEIR
jgi:hypothetical protein